MIMKKKAYQISAYGYHSLKKPSLGWICAVFQWHQTRNLTSFRANYSLLSKCIRKWWCCLEASAKNQFYIASWWIRHLPHTSLQSPVINNLCHINTPDKGKSPRWSKILRRKKLPSAWGVSVRLQENAQQFCEETETATFLKRPLSFLCSRADAFRVGVNFSLRRNSLSCISGVCKSSSPWQDHPLRMLKYRHLPRKKNCRRCGRSMLKCTLGSKHRWIQQIRNVTPRALNFSMRAKMGILLLLPKFAEGCSVRGCRWLRSVTVKSSYETFWHLSFPQTTIRCYRDL